VARRKARLTESVQQLGDITIGDALGFGNVQVIKAGTQALDVNADLVLMALDSDATLVLPPINNAVISYPYKIRNVGSANLIVETSESQQLDRRENNTSSELPPMGSVAFAAIEQDDGSREWVVLDAAFITPSFPRMVSGAIIDDATVNPPLGRITTLGGNVTTINLPTNAPMGSTIGLLNGHGSTINPTIDAGSGAEVQDIGGLNDYAQSHASLGLTARCTVVYTYSADTARWTILSLTV
jgi:hypothetical protein